MYILLTIYTVTIYLFATSFSLGAQNIVVMNRKGLYDNRISYDQKISSIEARSKIDCISKCARIFNCKSVFFHSLNKTCHLHGDFMLPGYNSIIVDGWLYYSRDLTNLDVLTTEIPDPCSACPSSNGYTCMQSVSFCYKYHDQSGKDPTQSRAVCTDEGGDLVRIDSSSKQTVVEDVLSTITYGEIWIQGRYYNGDWRFEDGTSMPYSNWNIGEGSGVASQPLIIMRKTNGYKWHDAATYHTEFGMICEILI